MLSTPRIPPWGLCLLPEIGNPCSLQLLPRPARQARARLAQLAQGAARPRCTHVLTAPALAGGVMYEAQENTPGIKPEYYPR